MKRIAAMNSDVPRVGLELVRGEIGHTRPPGHLRIRAVGPRHDAERPADAVGAGD